MPIPTLEVSEDLDTCSACGSRIPSGAPRWINVGTSRNIMCPACVTAQAYAPISPGTICLWCGLSINEPVERMHRLPLGGFICSNCYSRFSIHCTECGDLVHIDNACSTNGDNLLCPSCFDSYEEDSGITANDDCDLYDYSYKPDPIFRHLNTEKNRRDTWYAGIEIEVNYPSNRSCGYYINALKEKDKYNLFYCKEDSSIGPYGFEIVSHPVSWNWMKVNSDWVDPISNLGRFGIISYHADNCGMHVHTSKRVWGPLSLKKIHHFFRNNQQFILKFSNRSKSKFNNYASIVGGDKQETLICKYKTCGMRNKAINLSPRTTVEFRLFRGTINKNAINRNIEFCHALWSHSLNVNIITLESFRDYLLKYKKIYPNALDKVQAILTMHPYYINSEGYKYMSLESDRNQDKRAGRIIWSRSELFDPYERQAAEGI